MMSAKTVSTEKPASTAPATNNSATTPAAPGEGTTEFQDLLAGAVPVAEPSLVDALPALPAPPVPQLLLVKTAPAKTSGAPATAAPLPADVLPADMLKILDDAATLLPETPDGATADIPKKLIDTNDVAKKDDDILAEWLEAMIPAGVFAPQAGANNTGDALQGQGGETSGKGAAGATPASLMHQALMPEQLNPIDVAPQGAASAALAAAPDLKGVALAVAQNPATAFTAALTGKTETADKDKPSADGWMSALGDLATRRAADAAPSLAPRLSTPVHDARWADALAHRLVMMVRDGDSSASLKLVPADLGPLDIQINVRDGEASVHFGAAHQETRAVLEASLPRLRELLGAQGLQLSNASVSHQSAGQNRPERSSGPAAIGAVTEEADAAAAKAVSLSLLDIYA